MSQQPAQAAAAPLQPGLIVANYGRHFLLETERGERLTVHSRGKKTLALVGDRVGWRVSQDAGVIERIEPRKNAFYRQDAWRTKSFAANLDQVLMLLAAKPEFSSAQLSRALIAAEAAGIGALVVLNKRDLADPFARAWAWLQPYREMHYPVLPLSLKTDPASSALADLLRGKTTLVLGPSGAGKSTLINQLVPHALAQTGVLSRGLNTGKHTTTCTTWYWVNRHEKTALIDSPGFQEFGLNHLDPSQLAQHMPDLRQHATQCKFYNCSHRHEPGCSVMAALHAPGPNALCANRYKIYRDLYSELSAAKK